MERKSERRLESEDENQTGDGGAGTGREDGAIEMAHHCVTRSVCVNTETDRLKNTTPRQLGEELSCGERKREADESEDREQGRDKEPTTLHPSLSPSVSPTDTWAPSISNHSSPSPTIPASLSLSLSSSSSSSSSPVPSLTPPLPPSVELSSVLADTRLTLDLYYGGSAVLRILWGSIPGQLRGLQYLRLGSEDRAGLEGALDVLPHLTHLRSLAIRGTEPHTNVQCCYRDIV